MSKRIQDLTPPPTRWRKAIWGFVSRPFESLSAGQKFWLGFAFLCLLTTLLLDNPLWRSSDGIEYKVGEIARERIVAPSDIYFVDEEETNRIRETVMDAVPATFSSESKRADQAVQSFRTAWESVERKTSALASNRSNSSNRNDTAANANPPSDLARVFSLRKFSANELEAVVRVLRESAGGDIYADQDEPFLQGEIAITDRQRPTDTRASQNPLTTMTKLSDARAQLREGLGRIQSLSAKEADAFATALSPMIQPSVIYDGAATENQRKKAADSVQPVAISLKRSETIVEQGTRITPQVLSQIAAIRNYSSSNRQINRFVGLLILISALFWGAWKFIEQRGLVQRLALSERKTFALFGFIVVIQTALMAMCFRLAEFTASQNVKAPMSDPSLWAFAVPFAMGSLLMTLLADRRTALFTGIFTAILAGFLAPRGLEFAVYAIVSSSVAVYGIGRYRSRQTVTIAGAFVGLAGAFLAIAIIAYSQQPFILNTVLLAVACGLASGVITAALTAMFLPLCESLFGILTDVKLLELSNADLPVLGQLALRAPGTNQHSHAVGQLAEEACRVVGGNALLTRIGALYHDIGKTAAPEHFVENQMGKNPHDRLKPAQSAKIIISHVTYGTKLAKEMGLPQRIVDFIPQHHGTRTLHYFLKKAQAEARSGDEVSENDFRYPGPKPQFREAAIMMIADSCEAAARSLAEPTPDNIRFIVTKIIDAIVADDQLDECDLTLRELTQIREAMIRSLVAIYHSRIDYPGYTPPPSQSRIIIPADLDSEERGMKYKNPADIPVSPGGEIEDEALDRSLEPNKAKFVG
ncbi:MAG TPA: HDIG domain-containing protein [Pyrinomonadaceae bacterium]|nr:HDIG domain-containing protein [Pyrinomonadaceae bacterium]